MAVSHLDRRLLAILAADVVSYSRLMEADEPGTIARLKAIRTELAEPLVAEHHGGIVKLMGDGVLVVFERGRPSRARSPSRRPCRSATPQCLKPSGSCSGSASTSATWRWSTATSTASEVVAALAGQLCDPGVCHPTTVATTSRASST